MRTLLTLGELLGQETMAEVEVGLETVTLLGVPGTMIVSVAVEEYPPWEATLSVNT